MGEQFSASAFGGNRFPDHEFMIERLPGRVKHEGFSRENLKTRRFDRLGVCNSKTLAATQGREWNHPKHSNLHRKSQIRSSSTRWPIEPHLWVLKGRKQSGNKQVSCGHFRRWQEFSRSSLHTPSPLSPQKPMRVSTSDPSLDAPLSSSPPDRESPGAVCSCSFLRWFTQTRRGRDALAVPGDRDSGDPCDRVELTGSSSNLDGFPEPPRDDGAPGCDGDDRDDLRTTGGDSDDDDDDDDDDDEVRNDPPGDGSLRNPGAGSGAPVEMDASGVGSDADADADADAPADREADADGVSSVLCKNVDALYRKRFLDAMERGIINLVLSGVAFLDPSENKACKNMTCVKKLAKARMNGIKIKMEDTIDQKTTILVMTTASNNKEEASIRSFKALKCSLLGIPIVPIDWVWDCIRMGRIKIPKHFIRTLLMSSTSQTTSGTPPMDERARYGVLRLATMQCIDPKNLLFRNTTVFMYGKYTSERKKSIVELLRAGGANVISTVRNARSELETLADSDGRAMSPSVSHKKFVLLTGDRGLPVHKPLLKVVEDALRAASSRTIYVVDSSWVGHSIACADMLAPVLFKSNVAVGLWKLSKDLPKEAQKLSDGTVGGVGEKSEADLFGKKTRIPLK